MYSNELNISIGLYISKQLAKYTIHHGVLIEVYGEGVLIIGESGIGKSEVAMEMLRKTFYLSPMMQFQLPESVTV